MSFGFYFNGRFNFFPSCNSENEINGDESISELYIVVCINIFRNVTPVLDFFRRALRLRYV